jgi:hypothetical protein
MKSFLNCTHAVWNKTKSGKLHPSGDGTCAYPWKMPQLPASMYWIGSGLRAPTPSGGYISRKTELKEHCVYFSRKEQRSEPIL